MTTKSQFKENDKFELDDLRTFTKTEGWNIIPKVDKEQILRRLRYLEEKLGVTSEPYNET